MLNNAILPTAEQLAPLLEEATSNQSKEDFVSQFVKNTANILTSHPMTYRAYGMYWWAIKDLLNAHGFKQFGETLELGAFNTFNYEDKALLCCAAWAYHSYNVENGNIYTATHKVAVADEDDSDYYLDDQEIELLIQSK